jgi:hypothetical protein
MLTAMLRRTISALALTILGALSLAAQPSSGLRFEVTLDPSLPAQPPGRLLVVLVGAGGGSSDRVEPRRFIGRAGRGAVPTLGADAPALGPGALVIVDAAAAAIFPLERFTDLAAGDYRVQAVLVTNRDLRAPDAPGNLYSDSVRVTLGPPRAAPVRLTLTRRVPDEALPPDTPFLRFIKFRSERLSAFHGRPIYLRAGVILPEGYDRETDLRYPLRVRIGGYGDRYTEVQSMMRPGSSFRAAWTASDAPRMLLLHLDGAGPLGDPYQVNSANNGPFGDAVTQELIPHIEREFRGVGAPHARVLDGASTGGWVALALQMFYPDVFNGAWASCPDSVDFRALQRVDVYAGDSAYVDEQGVDLPSARNLDGSVRFTMRHELRMENVLGVGDSWTTSGRQWGAWNAAYGPRGADGRPVPLWDPQTGRINRAVARHWERYDLRLRLERDWDALAPQLRGKLNIWVGEMDDYFLNDAVHLFDQFLATKPPLGARFTYGPDRGHCWTGISAAEMMREMARAMSR